MASSGSRVTVGTTPTLVAQAPRETRTAEPQWVSVFLPSGAVAVDFGGPTVATGAGFSPVAVATSGTIFTFQLGVGEALYGVVASGTQVVHVLSNYA